MTEKNEEPCDGTVTGEQRQPGASPNGGRIDGFARLGSGVVMLATGVFLWRKPEMLGFAVASQRPLGINVPFFTVAGTLIWLLAPYGLMIGGVVIATQGAWRAMFGGSAGIKAAPPASS